MAGRIPQSFINDLLQRVDIVEVIDARVGLKKAGRNYKACCPFHEEKTPSFNVNPDRGFYKCFGCGVAGTAITFLMEYEHLEFVEAIEALARTVGVEVPREAGRADRKPDEELYVLLRKTAGLYRRALGQHPESGRARDYLKGRGLTGEIGRDFGIGYAPPGWGFIREALGTNDAVMGKLTDAGVLARSEGGRPYDRLRDRVVFPIRDTRGRVVGFGGRVLPGEGEDQGPKYLNSPETPVFRKARELYGLYEARRTPGKRLERLIVVEGYMDVVALAQQGIDNAVATLGTAVGRDHLEKLFRNVPEVVCCFDGDTAGREAAWRALEVGLASLDEGRRLKFVFLPEGEDPDTLVRSAGKAAFEKLVAEAVPAGDYLVERLSAGLDLTSLDDRAVFGESARPLLARIPPGVHRQVLIERIAGQIGVAPGTLDSSDARAPEPVATRSARPAAPGGTGESRLGERLLGDLLRTPVLFRSLPAPLSEALFDAGREDSLFPQVAREVSGDPDVESAVLLARFSRHPGYETLCTLAATPPELSAEDIANGFPEGVRHYVRARSGADRRKLLDGSRDQLSRYWRAKQESMRFERGREAQPADASDR
ncbi:MAG: DNA primase [Gammaproteobacteria bacterium]|nr:DNA primase [Gammaproteobacteria bacterium]MYE81329.1 DNA primase [Gammaproteobacteria bacterium]